MAKKRGERLNFVPEQYDYADVIAPIELDGPEKKELNPKEQGQTVKKYEPVSKAICGRVWSEIQRKPWTDRNGKQREAAYFKLFLWSGEEKYRCEVLFEQALELLAVVKKGDWLCCFGMDDLVETHNGLKRYHNFRVVKVWVLPHDNGLIDWRVLLTTIRQLTRGYTEAIERIEAIEKQLGIKPKLPPPKGDTPKLKKRQSLQGIIGDIYDDIDAD